MIPRIIFPQAGQTVRSRYGSAPHLRSQRGQARAKNVEWRLDYQVITPRLADRVTGASIYTGEKFSDHAPQIMEYDLEISP